MSKTNNIEIVSVTFGAGESRLFAMSGNYFEIIDAPGAIDVILSAYTGEQRARMSQAAASFYSKGVEFGVIQITSSTAQTIRFAYGSGETGTRRSTGSVTISGAIALDAATLAALEQINVRPEVSTGNYKALANLAANTPDTVFTPAANANGAILLNAFGSGHSAGAPTQPTFIAKNAAPATVVDGEVIYSAPCNGYGGGTWVSAGDMPAPRYVPPGLGLYFMVTDPASYCYRHCRYKLL